MEAVESKTTSLGERLLKAREQAQQASYEKLLEIPGYSGQLFARYRPVDFFELREIAQEHKRIQPEKEQELRVAADTLLAACVACEAHIDEEVKPLPPLGLRLHEAIGLDGAPENDRQALFEIFGGATPKTAVMLHLVAVQQFEDLANAEIDDKLVGE